MATINDVLHECDQRGIKYSKKNEKLIVIECINLKNHSCGAPLDTASAILLNSDRSLRGYKCFHSGCDNLSLKDLLIHLDLLKGHNQNHKTTKSRKINDLNFLAPDLEEQRFPVNTFGVHADLILDMHKSIKIPISMAAQILLGAMNAGTQGLVNVQAGPIECISSLFLLTLALSGERKSSAAKLILTPIEEFDKQSYFKYNILYKKYTKELRESICEDPPQPIKPGFLVENFTYEGLMKAFDNGYPIKAIFSPEAGILFNGFSFSKDNLLKTISGLSLLWDGKTTTTFRAKDNLPIRVGGKRLSAHLMVQPSAAAGVLGNPMVTKQGFLSRFLISHSGSLIGSRTFENIDLKSLPSMTLFTTQLKTVLSLLPSDLEPQNLEICPKTISPNSKAMEIWIEFHDFVEKNSSEQGLYFDVQEFALKCPEQALRIAATLEVFDNPNAGEISLELMERAIRLTQYYLDERLRIQRSMMSDYTKSELEKVLNYLKSLGMDEFASTQLLQKGPRFMRNREKLDKIMNALEDLGHLFVVEHRSGKTVRWRLNDVNVENN